MLDTTSELIFYRSKLKLYGLLLTGLVLAVACGVFIISPDHTGPDYSSQLFYLVNVPIFFWFFWIKNRRMKLGVLIALLGTEALYSKFGPISYAVEGLLLFAAACPITIKQIISKKPAIILNNDGFVIAGNLSGDIRGQWSDVSGVVIVNVPFFNFNPLTSGRPKFRSFLGFNVKNDSDFFDRYPRLKKGSRRQKRTMGVSFSCSVDYLNKPSEEIIMQIRNFAAQRKLPFSSHQPPY